MASLPRPAILLLSFIFISALSVTSMAFYSSGQVETGLKSLAAHTQCKGLFIVRNLVHDRGLFSSWGTADLDINPACANGSKTRDPALLSFKIEYQVNHLPSFDGMSRFHWIGKAGDDAVIDLSQLSSSGALMEGQGKLTYGFKTSSTITMGDLEIADDDDRLNVKGVQGAIIAGGDEIQFEIQSQKLIALSSETSLEAEKLKIKVDLLDWRTANGRTELEIDAITIPLGALKGLKIASQSSDNGTTISSETQIGIREIFGEGQHIEGLELAVDLKGLNKKHIETLTQLMGSLTQDDSLNQQFIAKTCEAGTGLLKNGFNFKISKIAGKRGNGAVNGDLSLDVLAAKEGIPYRASSQIASKGSLLMSHVLDSDQVKEALSTGFVAETPEGLKLSYSLSDGLLKVGDHIIDTPEVRSFFTELDQNVLEIFNYCANPAALTGLANVAEETVPDIQHPGMMAEDIPVEEESSGGFAQPEQGERAELNRFRAKEAMEKSDAEINRIWKLAPKEYRQGALKDQREWLKLRDKTCNEAAEAVSQDDVLMRDATRFNCVADMTQARIEALKGIFGSSSRGTP